MSLAKPLATILESPLVYSAWQSRFRDAKLIPFRRHNDLSRIANVVDVGCGPGFHARDFEASEYTGVDINPKYIAYARRKYPGRFVTADVSRELPVPAGSADCVFINSLLHHLDDDMVASSMNLAREALSDEGTVHIIDLVLPESRSLARTLARMDRGDHPRPLARWLELFEATFEPVVVEEFAVRAFGLPLWHLVYFKGVPR